MRCDLKKPSQRGIGTLAGREPSALPKTVNSIMPKVEPGQLVMVKRTNRHFTGGISSNMVLRATLLLVISSAVV